MKSVLQRPRVFLWVAAWVLLFPGQAQANAGVPMIFLTLPGMMPQPAAGAIMIISL